MHLVRARPQAARDGRKFLLRIEDLDPTRAGPFIDGISRPALARLDWDEPVWSIQTHERICRSTRAEGADWSTLLRTALTAIAHRAARRAATIPAPAAASRQSRRREVYVLAARSAGARLAGLPSWREADGREFASGPPDRRRDRPQGCARLLSSELVVDRGRRRHARRARCRPPPFDPVSACCSLLVPERPTSTRW
jgi:hypothetical protein